MQVNNLKRLYNNKQIKIWLFFIPITIPIIKLIWLIGICLIYRKTIWIYDDFDIQIIIMIITLCYIMSVFHSHCIRLLSIIRFRQQDEKKITKNINIIMHYLYMNIRKDAFLFFCRLYRDFFKKRERETFIKIIIFFCLKDYILNWNWIEIYAEKNVMWQYLIIIFLSN